MEKKAKAELLAALRNTAHPEEFSKYVKKHTSGAEEYGLDKALIAVKTTRELTDLCDLLGNFLEAVLPSSLFQAEENDENNADQQESDPAERIAAALKKPGVLGFLGSVVVICRLLVDDVDRIAPESLWRVVCRLHDLILSVGPLNEKLQAQIVQLCETWYLQERDGAAHVAPQTLTWLLQSVLDKEKPAGDAKRLLRFKAAMKEMDIMHESSESLRRQIKQCVAHAYLLTNSDGKKLLQFFFELDVAFISELHNCIKGVLPYQKRHQVEAFAEIYYKAWKSASGHFKITIEEICLQDYVTSALHLRNATAIKQVNIILKYLIGQRAVAAAQREVEGLLEALYGGVLWRSLHAANPVVRENAIQQLSLVFPLIRADQPQREIDEALSTSFQRLTDCLVDPHPNVRKQAVLASGRILTFYWELLPMHTTQVILDLLFDQLAFDKTSTSVREGVFRAILAIAENPLSHSTLRAFLPKLRPLLNDVSDRVRHQFANLLNVVKKIKTIKFYEVVPADQILRSLGAEASDKIRASLAQVLENTFFPWSRKTVNELVERSLTMLLASDATDADRRGAVAFFSSLDFSSKNSEIPIAIPVKFITKLFSKVVVPWIELAKQKKADGDDDEEFDGNTKSGKSKKVSQIKKAKIFEFEISANDEEAIVSIMRIMATMWTSMQGPLAKEEHKNLQDTLAETFTDAHIVALDAAIPQCEPLYQIAAKLPAEKIPKFSDIVLGRAGEKKDIDADASSAATVMQCLFSWDIHYRKKIIGLLTDWLRAPFEAASSTSESTGKKGKSKSKRPEAGTSAEDKDALKRMRSGLTMLNSILVGGADWIRDETLLSPQFDAVVNVLLQYKDLASRVVDSDAQLPIGMQNSDLVHALSAGCRVIIHRAGLDLRSRTTQKKLAAAGNNVTQTDDSEKIAEYRKKADEYLTAMLNWIDATLADTHLEFFEEGEEMNELEEASEKQSFILRIAENVFVLTADFVGLNLALSPNLVESMVACAEKFLRIKYNDNQFTQAVCTTSWKLAICHLASIQTDDASGSLLGYDRLASMLMTSLRRDTSDDNRISVFGLRALLLLPQWAHSNPYKSIFLRHLWKTLYEPAIAEYAENPDQIEDARVSRQELARDTFLILTSVRRNTNLIKEVAAFAKEALATAEDPKLESWKCMEFVQMMLEEESDDGSVVQRKLTRQAAAPLQQLLMQVVGKLRELTGQDLSSMRQRANELLASCTSASQHAGAKKSK